MSYRHTVPNYHCGFGAGKSHAVNHRISLAHMSAVESAGTLHATTCGTAVMSALGTNRKVNDGEWVSRNLNMKDWAAKWRTEALKLHTKKSSYTN